MGNKSIAVYTYRWGRALFRSSGIHPEDERHPHVIKDFISSLKKNIRNKIANKWAEMRQPSSLVQKAFKLANDVEKQLQVMDSFKLEFPNFSPVEVNEISVEESSGDEFEVNEMSSGKRWGNNNNNNHKHSNFSNSHSFGNRPQHNKPQDNRQDKPWGQKGKDSKITLTQESAHFVPCRIQQQFLQTVQPGYEIEMGRTEKTRKEQHTGKWNYWRWFNSGLWSIGRSDAKGSRNIGQEWKDKKIREFTSLTTKGLLNRKLQQQCRSKR